MRICFRASGFPLTCQSTPLTETLALTKVNRLHRSRPPCAVTANVSRSFIRFWFLEVHLNFYERCQPRASRSNSLHRRERVGAITSPIRNCLISCALRDGGGALFSAFAGSSACPPRFRSDLQK